MRRSRVAIATLGCKVNQFDSEVIREEMHRRGFREVPFSQKADVYVINTCTVTGRADCQSRQLIRRAHRLNPEAVVVATGCYAEVFPDAARKVEGVTAVLENQAKFEVAALASRLRNGNRGPWRSPGKNGPLRHREVRGLSRHCRAFLKIQDGCDAACSYCIVPRARGRSRSVPPEKVADQLRVLHRNGYEEVVLTGVHLGGYGLDLSSPVSLAGLLTQLERTSELPTRIRLSSLEPVDFTEALLSVISDSVRICPHLHIPLQSGDNEILCRMNRRYTGERFESLIAQIVETIPTVCIGVDVIGGFPGEEDRHFKNTLDLIERLPIGYLHVFPFSPRPGTKASTLAGRIAGDELRKRCAILRELGRKKREAFYARFLHERLWVLEEEATVDEQGRRKGVSRNYIPIWIDSEKEHPTTEIAVEITEVRGQKVLGRRIHAVLDLADRSGKVIP